MKDVISFLDNIPDGTPLSLKMIEAVILKSIIPIKMDLGFVHDRLDSFEYKNKSEKTNQRTNQTPSNARTKQGNEKPKQVNQIQINTDFPTPSQSKHKKITKVSYSNVLQNKREERPRSVSRPRDTPTRDKSSRSGEAPPSRFSNKTFAEMVANSKIKPNFIRNIRVVSDNETERGQISNDLLNSYVCQDVGISAINSRSKDFIVVKCKSENEAKKLKNTLRTQYGEKISISNVRDTDPKFKIIGVSLNDQSPSQFILNLKEQNDFLKSAELTYAEHYSVPHKNGSYTNIVLSCNVQTLRRVLEKGSVICGLDNKIVHEQIDIIQCFNCQRFGHVAGTCKMQPCCKFCGQDHSSKLCGESDSFKCANCIRENKKGLRLNVGHKATDERCYMRAARISGLKKFASKN